MQQPTCDICGDPTDGYACHRCAAETERALTLVVDLAGEVETTVTRQARYATRGGQRAAPADHDGWAKVDGALRPTPLPVDLNASMRAAAGFNAVSTWARHVCEERGLNVLNPLVGPVCGGPVGCHRSCDLLRMQRTVHPAAYAARVLRDHLDWLRHQPEAAEAFDELKAAGHAIRRIVDAPPEQVVVGVCDCTAHLYAPRGAETVTCSDCKERWDVEASRDGLREQLRGYLVTAAEAATLVGLMYPGTVRGKMHDQIRQWASRGHLVQHPGADAPMYLFGDVIDRMTRHVASQQGGRSATVTANRD